WFFFPLVRATYDDYRAKRLIYEMERPYREDVYGGSTPEATYAFFIAALKKGDVELASKYFSPKRQAEWLKELRAQKRAGKMVEFIKTLPNLNDFKKKDVNAGQISYSKNFDAPEEVIEFQGKKFTIPAGPATYKILFLKNDFTQKWKIESL
ncbi:MAG: hypothetical protein HY006_00465, partial [Candidatus Sungbacteria bacterium]|nr:hypothetical protein [Candidatus Sungbacteria bacterium]